jgi:hypothetical protein
VTNVFVFKPDDRRARMAALVRAKILEEALRREAREAELRNGNAVDAVLNCSRYEELVDLLDIVDPEFRHSLTRTGDAFVHAAERIAGGARSATDFAKARAHLHALLDDVLDGAAEATSNPAIPREG